MESTTFTETLQHRGTLQGHGDWVTQVVPHPKDPTLLISGSRDKSMIMWKLKREPEGVIGVPMRRYSGHSNFLSDVVLSSDGNFGLTASWDHTLRLWDLNTAKTTKRFVGHTKAVLSVDFSPDNRQIVSGSADNTIKLWNTLGQCKFNFDSDPHTGWVSSVRFSPSPESPCLVSTGWDNVTKVWDVVNFKVDQSHKLHNGYINNACISPDASLLGTGGRDKNVILWDLYERKYTHTLYHGTEIYAMVFSPSRYWLCVAGGNGEIKIWDLESKRLIDEVVPDDLRKAHSAAGTLDSAQTVGVKPRPIACTCINWSKDGQTLFAGYTDNTIRIWQVTQK